MNIVQLGHEVVVEVNGKEKEFLILGSAETNPDKNIISHNSPIGKALIGHRIGDIVKLQLEERIIEYKIIAIN